MAVAETLFESEEYEKYRKPIQDIINFANTIDEKYREKCFEVLLYNYLNTVKKPSVSAQEIEKPFEMQIPVELKNFLQENKIDEETLEKLFLRQNGQTRPVYMIVEKRKPIAQLQIALLTALENALITPNGVLEFSIKDVRQRCIERNLYDGADFMNNFMNKAGLFTRLDNGNDIVKLSPVGKMELGNVIRAVTKQ